MQNLFIYSFAQILANMCPRFIETVPVTVSFSLYTSWGLLLCYIWKKKILILLKNQIFLIIRVLLLFFGFLNALWRSLSEKDVEYKSGSSTETMYRVTTLWLIVTMLYWGVSFGLSQRRKWWQWWRWLFLTCGLFLIFKFLLLWGWEWKMGWWDFWRWWKCSKTGCGNGYTTYKFIKSHWIVHLSHVWGLWM